MIERVEVVPGPGTVIRYGSVAAWAAPSASASLISFLAESARNLAPSPVGGDQVAAHMEGVLSRRDPEPHVAFAVVGPGDGGWSVLLHGAVQVWDGLRWNAPPPEVGWLRTSLAPRPALVVSAMGAHSPAPSPEALWDLGAGVVPGGGFVLLPSRRSAAAPQPHPTPVAGADRIDGAAGTEEAAETTVLAVAPSGPPTAVLPVVPVTPSPEGAAPEPEPPAEGPEPPADEPEAPAAGAGTAAVAGVGAETGAAGGAGAVAGPETAAETGGGAEPPPGPPGVTDLRPASVRDRVVAYPPLPPAGDPPRPVAGAPVVAGSPCPQGHVNRPGMATCARCGRPLDRGHHATGNRPALGCLITDDGEVYGLDVGYLIGSDPHRDPTVRGRLARPLSLPGADVSPAHAEIRLHDWDVMVVDRAADGGTHVYVPGATDWERLQPYQPRVLPAGAHIAVGQRVVTFVTPWRVDAVPAGHETSERY